MNPAIWVAVIGGVATVAASTIPAWISHHKTRKELRQVATSVKPLANGFTGAVLASLMEIKDDISSIKKDMKRFEDEAAVLKAAFLRLSPDDRSSLN